MVFCNLEEMYGECDYIEGHNPYFNRWFSAISYSDLKEMEIGGHNPYFNRWFSAIENAVIMGFKIASQSLF